MKVTYERYYIKGTPIKHKTTVDKWEYEGRIVYFTYYYGNTTIPMFTTNLRDFPSMCLIDDKATAKGVIQRMYREYKRKYVTTHTFEVRRVKITEEYE